MALLISLSAGFGQDDLAVSLPGGVRAVWDIQKAHRETTTTRERICLNGLWRWQPAEADGKQPPNRGWGYFKVPGCWPGITDYMQKDSQRVFAHPAWANQTFGKIQAAWYQREFAVPNEWTGRRLALSTNYLNSYAAAFVDGKKAGDLRFPGGELDLTQICQPGSTHTLTLLVIALPLKAVALSYTDSAAAREVKGSVSRRGLCGDVFLVSEPFGPRLCTVRAVTSVRKEEFTFGARLENLRADRDYVLSARVQDDGKTIREFTSKPFRAADCPDGRVDFTERWFPEKRWDIHTPQNLYTVEVSLRDSAKNALDVYWTRRFGFREFWIDRRDFYLNGTPLHLSAVPLDNAQIGAALSTYEAARESLERLKSIGINFVYTHNYDCEPGAHLSFSEILRAADDVGMLVALTQPHFSHYDWKATDADAQNGYARHAEFYADVAGAHPSVVMYAMSHNATGYEEDMNPDMIDGVHDPRDTWSARNAKLALRAEAIVSRIDPSRIVYHHASGNLGAMHVMNFYPNFVPIQELSDWFGHWAREGVKPAFLCEYGAPFTWDWTMYRGWFKGEREFGSAKVPWEFCLAEWNAQFLGDRAYDISEAEKANLRWEAKQFRAGNLWHRWDYPNEVGSSRFEERYPVLAMYLTDNWRAFRTWGVSAISPWEYGHFWKLREGVDKRRKDFAVDWEKIQRPGFSPDYIDQRYERMDLAFDRADWIATRAGEALVRNNRPLLAYIGGKPDHFTSKDHNFRPGETVEKQLIIVNDSREAITCTADWGLNLPTPLTGRKTVAIAPGKQERMALRFELPATLASGRHELTANFHFSTGETQTDSFVFDVAPPREPFARTTRIALFDPRGETRSLLDKLGMQSELVDSRADLSSFDLLLIGKAALTPEGNAPDITRVRGGLKVIVFEQTPQVLERRFGFRIAEYGLRTLFPRVADHPALAGLSAEHLHDWRGAATLLPEKLTYELRPRFGPTVQWCGIPVPRLWRCGNRGNVASVLIEKPARGDFLSLLDGAYALQYSALLEQQEGQGMILFCQADVTGRTESDPAAELLARNLLVHAATWKPVPRRKAVYAGESAGQNYLESAGISVRSYEGGKLSDDEVFVAGPGVGKIVERSAANVGEWLAAGGKMLAIGLNQKDVDALLPGKVGMRESEHINAFFPSAGIGKLLTGVAPGDVHNRDPRQLPLVARGAEIYGDGILAQSNAPHIIFCQLAPWQFDGTRQMNLKRTQRHVAVMLSRLLANLGVTSPTPTVERFQRPVVTGEAEKRWLVGFYLDQPEEWDDPYRFFRW